MKPFRKVFELSLAFFIFISLLVSIVAVNKSLAVKATEDKTEYYGTLKSELVPDMRELYGTVFKPVSNPALYKFSQPVEKGATLTVGHIFDPRKSDSRYEVLLIEPVNNSPYICSDENMNIKIEKNECLQLVASKDNSNEFEQTIKLPLTSPLFKTFPIFLRYKPGFRNQNMQANERLVQQSALAFALGYVSIKDRNTLVEYQFDSLSQKISTTEGLIGIDVDGDGKINNKPFSLESSYASKDEIVFRLGDSYLSTSIIDLEKNRVVMRTREAKEYLRQELEVGKVMADFSFVDFDNKKRSLSEFRGKYLLVDFWGLWCVDCRLEIPYQLEAYKRYRSRGFEILGLDSDENTEDVKAVLKKAGIPWTQARLDSIKNLIEVTYRIQEYPSAILIGPDGKVLVLDQQRLKGEKLLQTLNEILPR